MTNARILVYTRLGPNVDNDLASRLKRIEWEYLLNKYYHAPGETEHPGQPLNYNQGTPRGSWGRVAKQWSAE